MPKLIVQIENVEDLPIYLQTVVVPKLIEGFNAGVDGTDNWDLTEVNYK